MTVAMDYRNERTTPRDVDVAQVYTLLQSDPGLGPAELAEGLGGSPESVRRCLALLNDLALIRLTGDGGFTVVRPETGMTILLSRMQAWAARDGSGASGISLLPREWEVLQILAQGCTDEAVARNLGISLRTVRRITADLMDRLGASSRFQAGLRASRILADGSQRGRTAHFSSFVERRRVATSEKRGALS
jgi:DNA-binding CsgD family transcriptional regulator